MCRFIYGPLPCHYERDLLLLAHTDAANTSAAAGGRARAGTGGDVRAQGLAGRPARRGLQ